MSLSNATNIYCPGCAPGDFPQPHICGVTTTYRTGSTTSDAYQCSVCGMTVWMGQHHSCGGTPTYPIQGATRQVCEHCWCLEEHYATRVINGHFITSTKPHDVCCGCGSRRLKVSAP